MSSDVYSYGYIAALSNPLDPTRTEELGEALYDSQSLIGFSYDGGLLIIDFNRRSRERYDMYHTDINGSRIETRQGSLVATPMPAFEVAFEELSPELQEELRVIPESIQPFRCVWYNGVDMPLNRIKREDYLRCFT